MKCPKCSYLSLGNDERCGHCGYEFSLIESPAAPRPRATPLNLPPNPRPDTPSGPVRRTPRDGRFFSDDLLGRPLEGQADGAPLDLPLFEADRASLRPPQRPLAVRRPGHVTPRPRQVALRQAAGVLPLEPEPAQAVDDPPRASGTAVVPPSRPAETWRRVCAWAVDVCAVLLVDVLALYLTLRVAGLTPSQWALLPPLPLATFFAVLNGGYVVLLTATLGQTLGKMALEIVVVADGSPAVGVARATMRTVLAFVSLAPALLGLLWTCWGDGRPLHDRVCGTRVVSSVI